MRKILLILILLSGFNQVSFGCDEEDNLLIEKLKKIVEATHKKYKDYIMNPLQENGTFQKRFDINQTIIRLQFNKEDLLKGKAPQSTEDLRNLKNLIDKYTKYNECFITCREMCCMLSHFLIEEKMENFYWQQSKSIKDDIESLHCYIIYRLKSGKELYLCSWSNHCAVIDNKYEIQSHLDYVFYANSVFRQMFEKEILYKNIL